MLKQRIITALCLAAVLLAFLFAPAAASLLFFAVVVTIAAWEWADLAALSGKRRFSSGILDFPGGIKGEADPLLGMVDGGNRRTIKRRVGARTLNLVNLEHRPGGTAAKVCNRIGRAGGDAHEGQVEVVLVAVEAVGEA